MANDLRPALLLDFDDVLCLNNPYGGFDAKLALAQLADAPVDGPPCPSDLWARLFDSTAKELLARIDREFRPWYVLTTSWWWHFTHDEMSNILTRTGLDFVRDGLHVNWATPKGPRPARRQLEVDSWIAANPEWEELWVILDDALSGTGLRERHPQDEAPFIILCRENVGLTVVEYAKVRAALARRLARA